MSTPTASPLMQKIFSALMRKKPEYKALKNGDMLHAFTEYVNLSAAGIYPLLCVYSADGQNFRFFQEYY